MASDRFSHVASSLTSLDISYTEVQRLEFLKSMPLLQVLDMRSVVVDSRASTAAHRAPRHSDTATQRHRSTAARQHSD
jgi:hypothetical protein